MLRTLIISVVTVIALAGIGKAGESFNSFGQAVNTRTEVPTGITQ